MAVNFEKNTFEKRLKSMLCVDFVRMFTTPLFYLLVGICFVIPILILVMTTMIEGTVTVNPQTGIPSEPMEGFDNVWQILGAISSAGGMGAGAEGGAAMSMDLVSMCNINMMYFAIAVLVCIFVADDFRSGYAKNLFTVRAKKSDYVISKTVVCFLASAALIFAFFVGAMLGGKVAGLSFEMSGFNAGNLVFCVLSKMLLTLLFVPIYLAMSAVAKQKLWLSMLLSFGVGMFLFNIAPMVTPLDANPIHVVLCLAGGAMFAFGLGAVSNLILKKTALV